MIQVIAKEQTSEWFELRATGIGASESAAACGLSRWETAFDVWARKTGRTGEKQSNDVMELGTLLEPSIRKAAGRVYELDTASPGLCRHPDYPFVLASPDGILRDSRGLECKLTTDANDELGDDEDALPTEWLCQAQQQMAVCDFPAVVFAIAVLPSKVRQWMLANIGPEQTALAMTDAIESGKVPVHFKTIERHSKVISGILKRDTELWNHVETNEPPGIDWEHSRAAQGVRDAFAEAFTEQLVDLADTDADLWRKRQQRKKYIRDAEKWVKRCDAELLLKIRDNAGGMLPDGTPLKKVIVSPAYVEAYTREGYSYLKGGKK